MCLDLGDHCSHSDDAFARIFFPCSNAYIPQAARYTSLATFLLTCSSAAVNFRAPTPVFDYTRNPLYLPESYNPVVWRIAYTSFLFVCFLCVHVFLLWSSSAVAKRPHILLIISAYCYYPTPGGDLWRWIRLQPVT